MDKKNEFIKIIKANEGLIYKITTLYTKEIQDRDDLYQEIVFQLWKSYGSFKEKSKISTWMYRVALNTAIYQLERRKRVISTKPLDREILKLPDENDLEIEEKIKVMHEQIQELNLLEKGIVLLYLEGKNYTEIGEVIGITATNVGTRLSRIKEKLKKLNQKQH